jgi:hypothetical protein
LAGGVAGIAGALLVIAACALPYMHDSTGSASIFNPGYPGGLWFAIEPIAVILMAIAAGVAIVVSTQRILQIAAASILLATGVQTFFLFVGYAGLNLGSGERSAAPGSVIGVVAGLCLATGGLLALIRAGWWAGVRWPHQEVDNDGQIRADRRLHGGSVGEDDRESG